MLRKSMIALLAVAAVGMLSPDVAMARGGHGGGGGFAGGGGFHGGGMGGGGMRSAAVGGGGFRGAAIGGGALRSAPVGGSGFRSGAIGGGGFRSAAVGPRTFQGGFHRGFHRRAFFGGAGLVGPYAYYDGYDYPALADESYVDSGCYIVRERVHTRYGWRIRPVQVCG